MGYYKQLAVGIDDLIDRWENGEIHACFSINVSDLSKEEKELMNLYLENIDLLRKEQKTGLNLLENEWVKNKLIKIDH